MLFLMSKVPLYTGQCPHTVPEAGETGPRQHSRGGPVPSPEADPTSGLHPLSGAAPTLIARAIGTRDIQGYLAHQKTPTALGTP